MSLEIIVGRIVFESVGVFLLEKVGTFWRCVF